MSLNNDLSIMEEVNSSESTSSGVALKRKAPIDSEFCKRSCMKLYLQEESADVHFVFETNGEEKKLPAHKYMLAIGSPVFQSMFYGNLKEEGDVKIADATVEGFQEFLQFFYLADVTLTNENAAVVMNLVNKYGAVDCFPTCERFLMENITMDSVCGALELAVLFDRTEFRKSLLKIIINKPKEFFALDAFKKCSPEILASILECGKLDCKEKIVFDACIAWSENACVKKNLDPSEMTNIREQLGDCLYRIKFAEMDPLEVSRRVTRYGDLFTRVELLEMIALVTGDKTRTLQYFTRESQSNTIEWKDNATLTFSHVDFSDCYVSQVERTTLKMNKKTVLGAVATQIINNNSSSQRELKGVMQIYEIQKSGEIGISEQPFIAAIGGRVAPTNFTKLNKPIVIEAYKVYTIRITFDSSWIQKKFSTRKCGTSHSLAVQDCSVKFGGGLISHLYFN